MPFSCVQRTRLDSARVLWVAAPYDPALDVMHGEVHSINDTPATYPIRLPRAE